MKNNHVKLNFCVIVFVIYFISCAAGTLAQTDFGSLEGVVYDFDGVTPIESVKVDLQDENSEAIYTTLTGSDGKYSFSGINPGVYTLRAIIGDRNALINELEISFGQNLTRNLKLESSATNLKSKPSISLLTLRAASSDKSKQIIQPLIPGRIGTSISASTATALPINTQPARLPLSTPGVTTTGGTGTTINELSGFNFNGISSEQNAVRINGIDVTPFIVLSAESFQDTTAFFTNISKRQSLAPFSRFRIDENNYPANLGTGTGGKLLKDVLKGDKTYRGDIYDYISDDALTARNFFDIEKPSLRYHLFGARFSGPLPFTNDKVLFFFNYEGIRARSDALIYEAAASSSARLRANPVVLPILNTFLAGGAEIVSGASNDANFDILRLRTRNNALRNSVTTYLNYEVDGKNKIDFYYSRDYTREDTPEGVTGRRQIKNDLRQTAVLRYQRIFEKVTNEFIIGFNAAPSRLGARSPVVNGLDLSQTAVNIGGTVSVNAIPGQPFPLSVASPGGLLRRNRSFSGRGSLLTSSSFSLIDQITWNVNTHKLTFGGEVRFLNSYFNLLNGITYRFSNLEDLLQNRPSGVQFSGDLGNPGPLNTRDGGERQAVQQYFIGFAQDQWKIRNNLSLTYGLRYEYYTPISESKDRYALFDASTGTFTGTNTAFYKSVKTNFLPRIAISWAPKIDNEEIAKSQTVISSSFGMHVGPSPFRDQIKPIENDRIDSVLTGFTYPAAPTELINAYFNNPNRQSQPLAYERDYVNAERSFKYDIALKRRIYPLGPITSNTELFIFLAYVGNYSDRLLLRTIANKIVNVQTNPDPSQPAIITREFDVRQGNNLLKPFGEIDVRTSKGKSRYDSFQIRLRGAMPKLNFYLIDAQYTISRSVGNTNGGSQTITTGNPFDFNYDQGYNPDDARHKFNLSLIYGLPFGTGQRYLSNAGRLINHLIGDWSLGAIADFQSGRPLDVRITRPEVVYLDSAGRVFSTPALGRTAISNIPGGSGGTQRPNLIPGVNPYLNNDRNYLNPDAFTIPAPGEFGNLKRGALRGPVLSLVDLAIRKQFKNEERNKTYFELRLDITNLFNKTNFDRPSGTQATLPNVLGVGNNLLQPGQPYSRELTQNFGVLNRTFKREQDFGSSRQIQFSFVVYFNGGSEQLKP